MWPLFDCPSCGGIYTVEVQDQHDEDGAPVARCKNCYRLFRVGVQLEELNR